MNDLSKYAVNALLFQATFSCMRAYSVVDFNNHSPRRSAIRKVRETFDKQREDASFSVFLSRLSLNCRQFQSMS
jgi:hypothetical protein